MKLSTILLAAAASLSVAYAQTSEEAPATVAPGGGSDTTTAPVETTTAPTTAPETSSDSTSAPTTAKPDAPTTTEKPSGGSQATTTAPSTSGGSAADTTGDGVQTNTDAGKSPLDGLKQKTYGKEYHMPYIRVVQARVQSDKPELVKGRFVSKFGNGDLEAGYRSGLDTVNTASVEGALMFVQAEGINQNARGKEERCKRKNDMNYVVLYEILIAQTNETIAQFEQTWNIPEYGPMIPMDTGRCTPLSGDDVFPPECLQMNGDKGQPNIGPFVGGGLKDDDVRAPYPNTYWFSFPHTCPLKIWGEKNDANNACRASTRKGLCDIGQAPDGFNCTFAYDVLGWVPIDDVVGITAIKDDSGKAYKNFTTWCEASEEHIEFAGDDRSGKMEKGLPFWEDPLNTTRNAERAAKVVSLYQDILAGDFKTGLVPASDLKYFKDLPSPKALTDMNPPCYKSVRTCNSGSGCKRSGFSQICMPCKDGETCKTDASFTLPVLEKAKTTLSEEELTSGSKLGGKNGATGGISKKNSTTTGAAAVVGMSIYSVAATLAASTVLALAL